jgi:hypothetical protein
MMKKKNKSSKENIRYYMEASPGITRGGFHVDMNK